MWGAVVLDSHSDTCCAFWTLVPPNIKWGQLSKGGSMKTFQGLQAEALPKAQRILF